MKVSSKEVSLATTQRRRGGVHGSVVHLKDRTCQLNNKEEVTKKDIPSSKHLLKNTVALDAEFTHLHYAVVDHIDDEDKNALDAKQEVLGKQT